MPLIIEISAPVSIKNLNFPVLPRSTPIVTVSNLDMWCILQSLIKSDDNHLLQTSGGCRVARQLPSVVSRSDPALTLGFTELNGLSTDTILKAIVSTDTPKLIFNILTDTYFTRGLPEIPGDMTFTPTIKATQNRLHTAGGKPYSTQRIYSLHVPAGYIYYTLRGAH